jgi:hypothetical protein
LGKSANVPFAPIAVIAAKFASDPDVAQLASGSRQLECAHFRTAPIHLLPVDLIAIDFQSPVFHNGKEPPMKISARNQLKGTIVDIVKGATKAVPAVIKASDVAGVD